MTELPKIGLGTSQNDDPEQCAESVVTALDIGYRHVDTAQLYGNEAHVGEGFRRSSVPREEIIVASKIHEDRNAYDEVIAGAEESRERLGVDTIDLFYVHFPLNDYAPEETLPAFDELRDRGVIGDVAVSNFDVGEIEAAIDVLDAPLVANQIEIHPLLPPEPEQLESARRHGYQLLAYSPFCRGRAFELDEVSTVADKHGVSKAQAILAWLFSHDVVGAIPKGTSEAHLRDNFEAQSLELDPGDVELIDSVEERHRKFDRNDR